MAPPPQEHLYSEAVEMGLLFGRITGNEQECQVERLVRKSVPQN